jgi:hydrogenase expression/formation protein HypD
MSDIGQLTKLAGKPEVTIGAYPHVMRIPDHAGQSLELARQKGANVITVNSALEVVDLAAANPSMQYVFAAFGFESITPHTAVAVLEAHLKGLKNFSVFVAHRLIVPALLAVLQQAEPKIDGILCNDSLPVILGVNSFRRVVSRFSIPCVVGGFEDAQVLETLATLAELAAKRDARLVNHFPEAITDWGNRRAQNLIHAVFTNCDTTWRGLGMIAHSGQVLRRQFRDFDARLRFSLPAAFPEAPSPCRCGDVLMAKCKPGECSLFSSACTPDAPAGPCMASTDGACHVWYMLQNDPNKRIHLQL